MICFGEFILPYEAVLLLDFLPTTYAAADEAGGWDRAALESPLVFRGNSARFSFFVDGEARSLNGAEACSNRQGSTQQTLGCGPF